MHGDFTRVTFDPRKRFSRVLQQQGRVLLDADWNEQTAILLHYLRTLATDLIGPYGGPTGSAGFKIEESGTNDLKIGAGRYYVEGHLCEVFDDTTTYANQPFCPLNSNEKTLPPFPYLVYLDVWERHVSMHEDETIRETGLGGADTATRGQVVWRVHVTECTVENGLLSLVSPRGLLGDETVGDETVGDETVGDETVGERIASILEGFFKTLYDPHHQPRLAARANGQDSENDPCIAAPDARFRGLENQLYRVEIHTPGDSTTATYKFSRENGCVVFPVSAVKGSAVSLESLGRDDRRTLASGDWVELIDESQALRNEPGTIARVAKIDSDTLNVTLEPASGQTLTYGDSSRHLVLRRWDYRDAPGKLAADGALPLKEGGWIQLEDGIEIKFSPAESRVGPQKYRTGDYWLIPARIATGDVEWPRMAGSPEHLPPHGVGHCFAPLAIAYDGQGGARFGDLRCTFDRLACAPKGSETVAHSEIVAPIAPVKTRAARTTRVAKPIGTR